MADHFILEATVHFQAHRRGQKELHAGEAVAPVVPQRVPRVARLMALAIHLENLLRAGTVHDLAELARLGGVTRARITQIMNLLHLAPDIQEEILFLKGGQRGTGALLLAQLQPLAALLGWEEQRRRWRALQHGVPPRENLENP